MIVDGTKIAKDMEIELASLLKHLPKKKICFILFGENLASRKFIQMKEKVGQRLGVETTVFQKDMATTEDAVDFVKSVANDYDGIVIQLPIPQPLDMERILNIVPIDKDIDVLSHDAEEKYRVGKNDKLPPVARAVFEILKRHGVELNNKNVLVIGKGKLVGGAVAIAFDNLGITYKQIDKNTPNIDSLEIIKNADVIISGAGVPNLITPDMIKEGVVIIDAGTSEQAGRLVGDADPRCAEKSHLFTPVPGGVGPITVASLFWNLI